MTAADHRIELEELMAWLDGELPSGDAERVRAHVASCDECRRMEVDMRRVSARMSQWTVSDAPASLRLTSPASLFRRTRWMQLAAVLLLAVGGLATWQFTGPQQAKDSDVMFGAAEQDAPRERLQAQFAPPARAVEGVPEMQIRLGGPLLIRTTRLALVPHDFDTARTEMERIVAAAGGFVGQIAVSDARAGARSLGATLRIPAHRLDGTLASLKGLGHVTSESQQGEDVTQQSIDLDARLSNARASEARLKNILETRTGRLSDVLDVEREITRVRGEIEGMEAQRKALDGRITYAEVIVEMSEERKAAVDFGPLPVRTRLRNALVDGWSSAATSALEATLFVARVAPVLLLWTLVLAPAAWLLKRRFMTREYHVDSEDE